MSKKRSTHERRADLQFKTSMLCRVHLVLLIEMPAKHFSQLMDRMFNLESSAAAHQRLLYKLDNKLIKTAFSLTIIYKHTSVAL